MDPTTTGERVRLLRLRKGLDQADVARELGVSRSMISMWEHGRVQIPTRMLSPLARLLDVTPNQLLGWDEIDDSFPDLMASG